MADEDFPPLQLDPSVVLRDIAYVLGGLAEDLQTCSRARVIDPAPFAARIAYVRGMAAQACHDLGDIERQLMHAARWNARRPAPAVVDF